jgi:hypothetical protein
VTIREYSHRALPLHWGGGIQEGPASGDHVNIMGNHEMIETVLEAVTGRGCTSWPLNSDYSQLYDPFCLQIYQQRKRLVS